MIKHQIVHDTRARGMAASSFGAGFTLTVDETSSADYIFNWLKVKSVFGGRIETLSIIAHGRSMIVNLSTTNFSLSPDVLMQTVSDKLKFVGQDF